MGWGELLRLPASQFDDLLFGRLIEPRPRGHNRGELRVDNPRFNPKRAAFYAAPDRECRFPRCFWQVFESKREHST